VEGCGTDVIDARRLREKCLQAAPAGLPRCQKHGRWLILPLTQLSQERGEGFISTWAGESHADERLVFAQIGQTRRVGGLGSVLANAQEWFD